MFEHSVRVPRHFKIAANIFKKVSTEGGSVKTLLYDDKLRHFRTNVLYALVTETIKHASHIDKLFENCSLFMNEPRLDPWLAKVLTAEVLFGKKTLPGKSKPEQTILSYKEQFNKYNSEHPDDLKTEVARRPRYVRINTNLLTTSDAIRAFQDEGYHFIRCTSGSYDDYLKQIQNLTEYDFTQDYHVKTVFVFPSGTKLHEHELYLENKIILQDKATALAVQLLAAPPGSVTLDMCAAPGMKTTQLAAFMRNEGKIYAVERNEKRYQTLCDFVERTESKCVETVHRDALEIKRGEYGDVEYILLDPSCSGSGMELSVHNYIDDTRLTKLTSLQEKFLKHAMNSFPKAKRIVYSTCSIFPEENERVITNIVKASRAKWRVQDVKELLKGQWNNFGSGMYGSIGTRCLYAKPDADFTTGFFLAVLDRDQKDLEKSQKLHDNVDNEHLESKKKDVDDDDNEEGNRDNESKNKMRKKKKSKIVANELGLEQGNKKKKKEKKDKSENVFQNSAVDVSTKFDENLGASEGNEVRKKKKQRKNNELSQSMDCITNSCSDNSEVLLKVDEVESKKKKKRKMEDNEYSTEDIQSTDNYHDSLKKKKKTKIMTLVNKSILEAYAEKSEISEIPKKKKKKKRDMVIKS